MSVLSKFRQGKRLPLSLVLITLAIGILIGTIINTDVQAERTEAVTDATPLEIPSPVQLQNEFSKLAQQIGPAVVNITTEYNPDPKEAQQGRRGEGSDSESDLFRRFFGEQAPRSAPRRATGSGFLVDPKGYIITNHHVVEGADAIQVKLVDDQSEHKATLVGFDIETDLAVIRIENGREFPYVRIGNSDAVQVGDWAVAIGSPFGLESTVTAGIVSAKGRDIGTQQFQRFIQTDAAINRGNSGGPLVNIRGEVIGVNTMIATSSGGYQGVGFALPINTAAKVYNMLIRSGRVTRGSIGVRFGGAQDPMLLEAFGLDHGVVVSEVQKGGPADQAGLKSDDVIIAIDGKAVENGDDLVARVADTPVGNSIKIAVDRGSKRMDFDVTVGDRAEVWRDDPRFSQYRQDEPSGLNEGTEAKFGIYVRNLAPAEFAEMNLDASGGIMITRVDQGSFAEKLGLRENDVIIAINRQPVESVEDIKEVQSTLRPGSPVAFRVARPFPTGRGQEMQWRPFYIAGELP